MDLPVDLSPAIKVVNFIHMFFVFPRPMSLGSQTRCWGWRCLHLDIALQESEGML